MACLLLVWRRTCRFVVVDDPRPGLRAAGRPYAYALLHAHQLSAVVLNDEARMAAMVSRSADGDLLVPSLTVRGVRAVRGSTRSTAAGRGDKGGRAALSELIRLVPRMPVLLAVDGPRGPRGHVHRGVADLAQTARATILPVLVLPSRRWILRRSWDRFQIPKPYASIRLIFGKPLAPPQHADSNSLEKLRAAIATALVELERRHDPAEAPK